MLITVAKSQHYLISLYADYTTRISGSGQLHATRTTLITMTPPIAPLQQSSHIVILRAALKKATVSFFNCM